MTSNVFESHAATGAGRSFYEDLHSREDDEDIEERAGLNIDEENLRHNFTDFDTNDLGPSDSRVTVASAALGAGEPQSRTGLYHSHRGSFSRWKSPEDDIDNDVPASLLVEPNEIDHNNAPTTRTRATRDPQRQRPSNAGPSAERTESRWETARAQQRLHHDTGDGVPARRQPRSLMAGRIPGGPKEKALWRWVNTSNLDSFMRDVYDYFEGGGLWCILCSNALWLL